MTLRHLTFSAFVVLTGCGPSPCASGPGASTAGTPPTAPAPAGAAPAVLHEQCFTVAAGMNTAETTALFASRGLQGGGPTWRAMLQAFARRHGSRVVPLDGPPPGAPDFGVAHGILLADGPTWFVLDDEADAAVFCSPHASLRAQVRRDVERANTVRAALLQALREAEPFDLE